MYIDLKHPQQDISKPNSTNTLKESYTVIMWDLLQGLSANQCGIPH